MAEENKQAEPEKKDEAETENKPTEERSIPDNIEPGMTVRIYQKIKEQNSKGEWKERVQYFEGMVIAKKHGKEAGGSITIHKISNGVGVEKIFPLHLPTITKIEIKRKARVRRSKLYFLKHGYTKKLKKAPLNS
ncbi:50S ribosomal protein L19 [Candidatus Falkowbacteria bacterium CG10_big_fil_rev_8_21_14_0_10_43_10]|uniref:50S ribosomal protein L19 n=1 Tax=Candidatus Falkowbacteria bacterium CG10_big_fil_rev_8_21_14_0_10_43_10 TaxID=1974567 RepID=A0A2H0V229_9BACT|nr:MAG: 50S ribosomal protein L19 [Candidatus Falkowbacteria bacterium CG10_big_fil_rev_8_21_14_0_10_43_10]